MAMTQAQDYRGKFNEYAKIVGKTRLLKSGSL
jgi:hypothetical protein